jgi:PAS domain S-box-containing protein
MLAARHAAQRPAQLVCRRLRDWRRSCWLVEATRDWIWELDASGTYTYSSPEVRELLGYEPEEVVGKNFFDLMPDHEAARVRTEFEICSKAGLSPRQMETLKVAKDGRVVRLESVVIPLLGARGAFEGHGGIDRDLAQPNNTPEAMALLESDVAHDLNNLLTVILGEAELLLDKADKPRFRGILAIQEAAQEASLLNKELLTFRRSQALSQPLYLDVIITNATNLLQRLLGKSIGLQIEFGASFEPVRTDPQSVLQVLMALAMSVRRTMTGGGSVRIKVSTRRLAESDHSQPAGVGLGYYIVLETTATSRIKRGDTHSLQPASSFDTGMKGTVQHYGGYLSASSSVNCGRILTILLPALPPIEPSEEISPTLAVEPEPNSGARTDVPVT